jgi:hypothetical protein
VLKRFVDGAEGAPFYQKRAPSARPEWLRTVTLAFPSGRTAEEIVVDDAAGLGGRDLVQRGKRTLRQQIRFQPGLDAAFCNRFSNRGRDHLAADGRPITLGGSHPTPRWSGMDSNFRFRAR